MPSDDYAVVSGGGALKLKGAKIGKKKKKKSAKTDLEKNLATGDESSVALVKRDTLADGHDDNGDYDDASASALKKRKKSPNREASGEDAQDDDDDDNERLPMVQKTEAERRHEEVRRKRLLDMAKTSGSRPELLKTHKERVEELNTYLSKLSEHHDMPKIGPG